jgi:hypothetical protein
MRRARSGPLTAALAVLAVAAGSSLVPPSAEAAVCAGRPADRALAQLFLESNAVATGTLAVDRAAVRKARAAGGYLDVPLVGLKSVAGQVPPRLSVKIYAGRGRGGVRPEQLERLAGTQVLAFLTKDRDGTFYFVGETGALQPATPAAVGAAETERDRQWAILRAWKPDRSLPHFGEVKALIAELAAIRRPPRGDDAAYDRARDRQDEIFAKLERLGKPAVPAIVAQLDDRRPLAVEQISLVNRPDHPIEALRHYGPEQIVDALAALLNQIAGPSFDAIYSGGSDAQRRSAVAAWRIYADDLLCYGR